MPDFLLEIGCEEIPARMLDAAANELGQGVAKLLDQAELKVFTSPNIFATPRRLALLVAGVRSRQADKEEVLQGPATKVAYSDGRPSPAAEAFAKKAGVPVAQLQKVQTPKGEYLAAHITRKGKSAAEVVTQSLPRIISSIYWPKNMYWRSGAPERFVRPVRWLVAMLDGEVIPLEFAGVRAGNRSRGHRLNRNAAVAIKSASGYQAALGKAHVLVDPAEREKMIRQALDQAARGIPGARWREDKALLNTVVNLTEWPSVILGSFDKEFLALPEEVLVTVMRDHQKYFAVEDSSGKLLPHFLAVLNTDGDPKGLIRHGNERVLRARFNDARFFWQADQKTPLDQRIDLLKAVTFQKDLGSYYEKTVRVERLTKNLAEDLLDMGIAFDREAVGSAAWLCKTDLTTEMVKEFTELQGIVGGLYARHQGMEQAVARAIYEHYRPESMEDAVPATPEGALLAIADKIDSIVGMFSLGLQPTGSKDPFALRRQANGVVRILAEHKLNLRLTRLFRMARAVYENRQLRTTGALYGYEESLASFFRERLEFYLREARGFAYDVVNAVLAAGSDRVVDAIARAEAVAAVRVQADFEAISLSFKRIKNILRQAAEKKIAAATEMQPALAQEDAERRLMEQSAVLAAQVERFKTAGDYAAALAEIAKLRPGLDTFFDKVMVMAQDEQLRANRLALLAGILRDFSTIADFSEIVTEKK